MGHPANGRMGGVLRGKKKVEHIQMILGGARKTFGIPLKPYREGEGLRCGQLRERKKRGLLASPIKS